MVPINCVNDSLSCPLPNAFIPATIVGLTISLGSLGALGFWSMMVFLGILTIGFIYEWKKGALEWE